MERSFFSRVYCCGPGGYGGFIEYKVLNWSSPSSYVIVIRSLRPSGIQSSFCATELFELFEISLIIDDSFTLLERRITHPVTLIHKNPRLPREIHTFVQPGYTLLYTFSRSQLRCRVLELHLVGYRSSKKLSREMNRFWSSFFFCHQSQSTTKFFFYYLTPFLPTNKFSLAVPQQMFIFAQVCHLAPP